MKKPTALLFLAALLASAALADESMQTNTFHFADPAKPGTVRITLLHGSVHVHGTDAADVVVRSNVHLASEVRADGLRVIGSSNGLEVSQHDNVLVLQGAEHHGDAVFDVNVPRQSAVAITTYTGRIQCANIAGDVDVHSMSGSITLEDMAGGATVEANNGRVRAGFSVLRPQHPVSVTSLNGEVVLYLPSDAKANLQLRTQNGTILTDYSEQQLVTTEVATPKKVKKSYSFTFDSDDDDDSREALRESAEQIRDAARDAAKEAQAAVREAADEAREGLAEAGIQLPPLPPLPPMTGGKTISGVLNGGGVEVEVTTLNGDVTIRKSPQPGSAQSDK